MREEANQEKRRKSSSEPVISSSYMDSKGQERMERMKANERSSVQFHDSKQKRPARPHSSVNEVSTHSYEQREWGVGGIYRCL